MKIESVVALVTGTHHALGAAMVRALLARGAAKVYAATRGANGAAQPGALPVTIDVTRPAQMHALARRLNDVTLLVNSVVHFEVGPSLLAGLHDGVPGLDRTPAGRSLQLIDAFAPVLAANGGGAVVNVLSVLSSPAPSDQGNSPGAVQTMDQVLNDGLRPRLAAQNTELLFLRTTLVEAGSDDLLQGHSTRADHLATRLLDALWPDRADASGRQQPFGDGT